MPVTFITPVLLLRPAALITVWAADVSGSQKGCFDSWLPMGAAVVLMVYSCSIVMLIWPDDPACMV